MAFGRSEDSRPCASDYAKAERRLADVEKIEQEEHDQLREHESVYYPAAADALRVEGFDAAVTGVRQRARGEWSTPDVVGFYVRPSSSLVVPIVRVGTVEVKHRLTRSGIAEAAAHRRFSHYSYVAVPEVFSDIAAELREECVRIGVGLMCFRQRNSVGFGVFLEPVMSRPDEELVDELLNSLRDEEDRLLAEKVRSQVRRELGLELFR